MQLRPWRHNLPPQPDLLIGREREIAELVAALQDGRTRLLTLTGVGGTGKTRLAISAAAAWLDVVAGEACFVDLAPVASSEAVIPTIANALGVHETPGVAPREAVARVLAGRRMLLVLDNCEHLLPASVEVAQLLARCHDLTVLATSREHLHLRLEREFQVAPLAVPPRVDVDIDQLRSWPAVALFAQRARAVAPRFELTPHNAASVVDVCSRLDGLPLAIELAAALSRVLEPAELVERLAHRLDLLSNLQRDVPDRHRTLVEAIRWSFDLLHATERTLFRQLAVFAGGWTVAAAEAVSDDPDATLSTLDALLSKSLVQVSQSTNAQKRFRFLETVRTFAVQQFVVADDAADVRARHARYYLDLAERAEAGMIGSDQDRWFPELESELENCRQALRWFIQSGEGELATRFGSALTVYWYPRGHYDEGSGWIMEALAMPGADAPRPWRVRALCRTAGLLLFKGDTSSARAYAQAALELAQEIDDADSIGQANHVSGLLALGLGDWQAALAHSRTALEIFRALDDWWWQAWSLDSLGLAWLHLGNLDEAHTAVTESLELRRAGKDLWGTAESLERIGQIHAQRGELERARPPLVESIMVRDSIADRRGLARGLEALAAVDVGRGDVERGTLLMGAAEGLRDALGSPLLRPEEAGHEFAMRTARRSVRAFEELWQRGRSLSMSEILVVAAQPASAAVAAPSEDGALAQLTTREREVASLISRGRTSREIAELLVVSVRTADTHADHIRDKLGLKSRAEIAAWAVNHGLSRPAS